MAEHDISSMPEYQWQTILGEIDTGDMTGFTRRFVDDLEAAMSMDAGIEADSDWSGVICPGRGGSGAGGRFLKGWEGHTPESQSLGNLVCPLLLEKKKYILPA